MYVGIWSSGYCVRESTSDIQFSDWLIVGWWPQYSVVLTDAYHSITLFWPTFIILLEWLLEKGSLCYIVCCSADSDDLCILCYSLLLQWWPGCLSLMQWWLLTLLFVRYSHSSDDTFYSLVWLTITEVFILCDFIWWWLYCDSDRIQWSDDLHCKSLIDTVTVFLSVSLILLREMQLCVYDTMYCVTSIVKWLFCQPRS